MNEPIHVWQKKVIMEQNQLFSEGLVLRNLEIDLLRLLKWINLDTDSCVSLLKETVETFLNGVIGEIPMHECDQPSPNGIATILFGNKSLLIAIYDTSKMVMN